MICTFIGHRDAPKEIEPILKQTLVELITKRGVSDFYVGTHGSFDYMALKILKELKIEFPDILYTRVLAYIPKKKYEYEDYSDTVFPDGLENVPPKFAINKRNEWMIERADYVVCYVIQNITNAGKFLKIAKRKGKIVLNIANNDKLN